MTPMGGGRHPSVATHFVAGLMDVGNLASVLVRAGSTPRYFHAPNSSDFFFSAPIFFHCQQQLCESSSLVLDETTCAPASNFYIIYF